jgi:tetratricopeptide (TPR) repeat protein
MSSKLQICCEAFMEACWLAAVAIIPLYFNISSVSLFELAKVLVLRFLVVLCVAAGLLKWIDRRISKTAHLNIAEPKRFALRHPLAISVSALAAIYILSSIFSITPIQSWWGSDLRSQGSIAFCCYVILFLVVLSELRTSAQLRRIQYAAILACIPISAYTILQFAGLDPIPWRDYLQGRSSGTIGNPIFLGGYLVMVIPATCGRFAEAVKMLRTKGSIKSGVVLAACCGIIILIQTAALICTQSRGPIAGLAFGFYTCVFLFLVLKRSPEKSSFIFPVAAAGLGLMAPALFILVVRVASKLPTSMALICLGAAILLIVAFYVALWFVSRIKSWLWLTWLVQTIALGLIIAAGPMHIMGENAKAFPSLGRLAQISNQSVDVRQMLWKTGLRALQSNAPALLPDGRKDAVHSFRPVIGYGPESIWFAVNLFGIPELQTNWSGDADRMHNEVFDNLMTIGFLGTILFLFVFAAAFFYSLRYLDLLAGKPRILLFAIFLIIGIGLGILIPWLAGSAHLAGIGVQAGMILGLFAYIAWIGFGHREMNFSGDNRQIYVICILCALIAHFIETSLGIAVTSTRTYCFLLFAVLAALISGEADAKESTSAKQRSPKPVSQRSMSPMPLIAVASLVVMTLAWCFVVNTTVEHSAWKLFLNTWFLPSHGQGGRFSLNVPLILMVLTIAGSIGLLPMDKSGLQPARRDYRPAFRISFGFLGFVWLAFGFLAAIFWAALDPSTSSPIDESLHAEARMTLFFIGLLLLLGIVAWSLVSAESQRYAAAAAIRVPVCVFGFLLAVGALVGVLNLTLVPAWADAASHIAHAFDNSNALMQAVPVYERAAKLAPNNISYCISLGLAQGRTSASSGTGYEKSFQSLRHALDLNPLDPATFHTLGSFYMQLGEQSPDPAVRDLQIQRAIPYFEQAVRLAPNSPRAYNGLARCYMLLGNFAKANSLVEESMRLYSLNARTYLLMGEMFYRQKNLERALQSYVQSIKYGGGIESKRNVALVLALMGRRQEAIRTDLEALETAPHDLQLLRQLALLYFSEGDNASGQAYARRAYDASPQSGNTSIESFIMILEDQAKQLLEQAMAQ